MIICIFNRIRKGFVEDDDAILHLERRLCVGAAWASLKPMHRIFYALSFDLCICFIRMGGRVLNLLSQT